MRDRVPAGWSLVATFVAACSFDGAGIMSGDASIDAPEGSDRDGDQVPDAADNCPDDANTGQENEDGDDHGNLCDNCPTVANDSQANDGETVAGETRDGAGDACDPDPDGAGNDILLFEGFDDAGALDSWREFLGGAWSVTGGQLRQSETSDIFTLYYADQQFDGAFVESRIILDDMPPPIDGNDGNRSFGTLTAFAPGTGLGAGYFCLLFQNPQTPTEAGLFDIFTIRGSQAAQLEAGINLNVPLAENGAYTLRQGHVTSTDALSCNVTSPDLDQAYSLTSDDNRYTLGSVAIRTQFVGVRVDYVVVYAVP